MNRRLNVAYHSSDLFAPVLGTSLVSLFENNQEMDEISVYVIEDHISAENMEKLRLLAAGYGRTISFIAMPDIKTAFDLDLVSASSSWEFFSFCRLFLDVLLPEDIHKVLYLDSDVLVEKSLMELWNIDLRGHCAAGVIDYLGEKYYKALRLNKESKYCNSGVLIEDLDQWRKQNIGDKVRAYVKSFHGYLYFVEQTALNGALQDSILILPPKYNVLTIEQILNRDERYLLRRNERGYREEEIRYAVENPVIVHMTRIFLITNRPWYKNTNHPMKNEYERYKALTPWKDTPGFEDTRSRGKRIVQKVVDILPRKMVLTVAGFLYNEWRIWRLNLNLKKYGVK